MSRPALDRDDPEARATLALREFARRERTIRVAGALALVAVALLGPLLAAVFADQGALVGAILASVLFAGTAAALWPWDWSTAERDHHASAAIWAEVRPDAGEDAPWARYAPWATAGDDHVELVLIRRSGTSDSAAAPSPYTRTVKRRLDPDEIADAALAMEALRVDAAELEARAYQHHLETVADAARQPYDDALNAVDEAADEHQRRAEIAMRQELAEQEAAERRVQATAVARALRRP